MQNQTNIEIQSQHAKSNLVQMGEKLVQGQLPTDTQVTHELNKAAEFLKEKENETVQPAKGMVYHDTRKFVESVQDVIEEKNFGERVQRFITDCAQLAELTPTANEPKEAWIETRDFVMSMKDLILDVTKSQSFRKSLVQLVKIIKDIFYEETNRDPSKKLEKDFVNQESPKTTAQDVAKETKKALQDLPNIEDLPEDKKRAIREQFKTMMGELNQHSETSFAFRKALKLWGRLNAELSFQLTREEVDPNIRKVELEAKQIIEILSGRSLDDFIARLKETIRIIENDGELNTYLNDIRNYLIEGLEKPEITQTDKFYDRVEEFISRGRQIARRYRENWNWNGLCDAADDIMTGIQSNDQFWNVQYRAEKLVKDFTVTDIKGNKHLDTDLIATMRQDLLPFLIDRIKEVPIPGFRLQNENFEYLIVDDLYVDVEDILPDMIRIHSRNDTDLTLKNFENPIKSESVVKVKIEGVRPKFHHFYFKFKRNSVLGVSDEGRANMFVTGSGVNIKMDFQIDVNNDNKGFLGDFEISVSVDHITLDITEANHKTLLNIVAPLFTKKIKDELESSLKVRIKQIASDWSAIVNKRILTVMPGVLPKGPIDGIAMTKLVDTIIE